jgi:pimeloyl-ACP methyl ester carboxylesterase
MSSDPDALGILRASEAMGVQWPGGYVQLTGPPVRRLRNGAVRHASLLSGTPPRTSVHGVLDRSAFPADPRVALGPRVAEVRYPIQRGTAPAWFVPGAGSTWALLVHGKGTTRVETLRLMRDTIAARLPSLDISYRNDPGLPADPSGHFQYGKTEWRDLASAVDYARAHGARHVDLVGVSMGGSIIASYLRHRPGAPVSALVLDAPLLSLADTVSHGAAQLSIPILGHVPGALTWTAEQIAAARYGADWSATDYIDDPSWVRVPTLLIHGDRDEKNPLADSQRLAHARPGLVRLITFHGAEHVASWNHYPAEYDAAVRTFLDHQ